MNNKILIVDDDPVLVKMLVDRLNKNGFNAKGTVNPIKGLQMALDFNPDVILLDVLMPEMNGHTFYLKLKMHADMSQIPVVIITARPQMKEAFLSLGVEGFMTKPFDVEDVIKQIKQLLPAQASTQNLASPSSHPVGESQRNRVLICGPEPAVVNFIAQELTQRGSDVKIVENPRDIELEAISFNPSYFIIEAQMDSGLIHALIQKLKEARNPKAKVLLFTYFKDKETAKNSIVHKLLSVEPTHNQPKSNFLSYVGIFNRTSFIQNLKGCMDA